MTVRPLATLRRTDRPLVGGKCAGLGELLAAGLDVPDGFAVTAEVFDPSGAVPDAVAEQVRAAYAELGERAGRRDVAVAVRSSAVAEDGALASWAGQQETFLGVRGAASVVEHVGRCWAGARSAQALAYGDAQGPAGAVAVGVQVLVDPVVSGVAFTVSPRTGDRSLVAVNAAWGLGEAVVAGLVQPDEVWLSKAGPQVVRRVVAHKGVRSVVTPDGVRTEPVPEALRDVACLDDRDAVRLARTVLAVERLAGSPQDVEWALLADGRVVVLQARAETTWRHALARAQVAAPAPVWLDGIRTAALARWRRAPHQP